jgi:hypothetical protein
MVEIMWVFLLSATANWREIKLLQTTVRDIVQNKSLKLGEREHFSLHVALSCISTEPHSEALR